MNRQIGQLFGLTVVLFALLIVFTSRWTVFEAQSLEDNCANRRPLIEEQKIPRGLIYARDGQTVLAENRSSGRGENRIFTRFYPQGELFAHPVGYSFIRNGRRSTELFRNDDLVGDEDEFESLLAELRGPDARGLRRGHEPRPGGHRGSDRGARRAAGRGGGGRAPDRQGARDGRGSLLRPQRGARGLRQRAARAPEPDHPGALPARLDLQGRDRRGGARQRQGHARDGDRRLLAPGGRAACRSRTPAAASFGPISFTDALTNSVNTVFAQVGERIGPNTLVEYMRRFGFYEDPQLDYPDSQMIASGIINGDGDYVDSGFDVGRVAIGQGGLEGEIRSSPLQMALVAATIGNGGRLMKPRLTDRVLRPDGRVKERVEPDLQSRVVEPETAEQLGQMMSRVVEEGTGTAAALSGITVAGKTGTAEVGANREFTQPWFIAFAPVDDPKMAVAVTVERTQGQGGTVAAPIARSVLESLLGGP